MTKENEKEFGIVKALKILGNILYWLVFLFLVLVAGGIAASNLNLPHGLKFYSVVSGSMEPAIHVGSIDVIQQEKEYKVGDVITFVPIDAKKGETVTHRIYSLKTQKGQLYFETKGDANKTPDTELTPITSVLGKEVFSIPLLGYPISYARTREGLIILIIIPATIIIYSELVSIKNETLRLLKERKKKLSLTEKVELEVGKEEIKAEKWYHRLFKKNEN